MNLAEHGSTSYPRHVPSDEAVRVAWVDQNGKVRCVPGRCIDVSARRIHIEVPERIPLQTRVSLKAGRKSIPGPTRVKYLTQYETKFILVLE